MYRMRILILGAGPTGLGAAWRLTEQGHNDWELWESESGPGGLSRSEVDEHGFVWDIGGHVQFSHYGSFDALMERALGADGWLEHERESWVRILERWVPYPFQYNIHRLPPEATLRCVQGLLAEQAHGQAGGGFANFDELIRRVFGAGIAELFMLPYNYKVWAYPPSELATGWIGERVALPDLGKIMEGIVLGRDHLSWGPNNRFHFPKEGGTGAVWRGVANLLPQEKLHYGKKVVRIDTVKREVEAEDGNRAGYDALISSLPLDVLVELAGLKSLRPAAQKLVYSTTHVIGVGLHGQPGPELAKKCWMYFPEDNCPFYRITVFSNYSPRNVPGDGQYWSLMAEVAQSPKRPVDEARVVEETVQGMLNTGLLESRAQVHHTWHRSFQRGYPTPALERDAALNVLLPELEKLAVYSRGRFGAWKYEVSNQDHSCAQGMEVASHILTGAPELTLWFPNVVNAMHPVLGKAWL
jgi:protoporphyrinogen oxidase